MNFWAELRRRSVFRVAAAYVVTAWLIMQIVSVASPALNLPAWFDGGVLLLLAIGLPITLVLAWAFEVTPEGVRRTASAEAADEHAPKKLVALDVLIAVAVVVVAGAVAYQGVRGLAATAPGTVDNVGVAGLPPPRQNIAGTDASKDEPSIAVLPFVNISSDPEQEYFSDGLSEELLNELAKLDGLMVIARTSSFAFKGQNIDVRTIAETLGANHVLEGSVRKSGTTLRITAQLIEAMSGVHLWSETYERQLDDVFAVQEDIAVAVADALSVTLDVGGPARRAGGTESFAAYDAYLRGRALQGALRSDEALEQFEQALSIDPNYAQAWAAMAYEYRGIAGTSSPNERIRAREAGERAALRAIEIAPDLWESQATLGALRLTQRRWADADRAMTRARDLAAADGAVMGQIYWAYLLGIGRLEDALAEIDNTQRLDPLAPGTADAALNVLYMLGRRKEPAASLGSPVIYVRYAYQLEQSDYAAARAMFAAAADANASAAADDQAKIMLEVLREPEDGLAGVRAAVQGERASSIVLAALAMSAAHFGDPDYAVELLRRAHLDSDEPVGYWIAWLPPLAQLRGTEAFKAYLRDLGLADFWRQTGKWGDFCRPVGEDDFECS